MARVSKTVGPIRHPDSGEAVVLRPGDEVPDWAEGLLDDNVLEGDAPAGQVDAAAVEGDEPDEAKPRGRARRQEG